MQAEASPLFMAKSIYYLCNWHIISWKMLRTEFTPPLSSPVLSLLISDNSTSFLRPPIKRKFSFATKMLRGCSYWVPEHLRLPQKIVLRSYLRLVIKSNVYLHRTEISTLSEVTKTKCGLPVITVSWYFSALVDFATSSTVKIMLENLTYMQWTFFGGPISQSCLSRYFSWKQLSNY